MNTRLLQCKEIPLLWQIDRRETIENVYYPRDGQLILEPEHFDMQGWPLGEAEYYTPLWIDCYDRGGVFWGAFENDKLMGAAILEHKWIGSQHDTLQLKFLHVSRDSRKQGLGTRLFNLAVEEVIHLCNTLG
ncbi:MAG TPA: GNAT family N-acetyltransferase [Anaerolineales bacterium]|nr:GNAT family N-acetyltransferase [Anaerolineales bacterium]